MDVGWDERTCFGWSGGAAVSVMGIHITGKLRLFTARNKNVNKFYGG